MAFKWMAFPCFAASISIGIGRCVSAGAESVKPSGASRMPLDARAPQPIAKLRRVNIMKLVPVPHRLSSCPGAVKCPKFGVNLKWRADAQKQAIEPKRPLPKQGAALRRTLKTFAVSECKVPFEISEFLLGHIPHGVSVRYILRWAMSSAKEIIEARKISKAIMVALRGGHARPKGRAVA